MVRPGFTRVVSFTVAGVVLVTAVYLLATLPPATVRIPNLLPTTTVIGAYHIHTVRSDGSGTLDDVARAAAAANLHFVLVTDHGDATATPEPPSYRHGVLVIDGVEVSTREGHVVALGLSAAAPYPLGGEARDAIEDIHRLAGWAVAAHPDSEKPDLRWRGPATDGIEWLNADSEWRDEPPPRLIGAAVRALVRTPASIATLFDRPVQTLRRWDQWARLRPVVGMAAVDAHARIGIDEREEPRGERTILARPSYRDMFRTLVQAVMLDGPLTGAADGDAAAIIDALRRGQTYSAVAAIATPPVLAVTSTASSLTAQVEGAPHADVRVYRGEELLASGTATATAADLRAGQHRVEVYWPGWDVPWIVAGRWIGDATQPLVEDTPSQSDVAESAVRLRLSPDEGWAIEQHQSSRTNWTSTGAGTRATFTLGSGRSAGQYAALVHPLPTDLGVDEVEFDIVASRPMRVSVQVRLPDAMRGERWLRSVFADNTPRHVRVRLSEFIPADRPISRTPVSAHLQSILFVVDSPHTPPGSQGWFEVSNVALRGPNVTSAR